MKRGEKPRGYYAREKKKNLAAQIRLALRWIDECTDPDRLECLKEYLWRLRYREGKRS